MRTLSFLLLLAILGCNNPQHNNTGIAQDPLPSGTPENACRDSTALHLKEKLEAVLRHSNMEGKYLLRCNNRPYHLEGDFNGDKKPDIALLINTHIPEEKDVKSGILIFSKDDPSIKPVIFGAGTAAFGMDNYDWIGIFDVIEAGNTIEPNWNEETQDYYMEDDVIPADKIVTLTCDAIFVHQDEAGGGGFIYWKNGKFNWMQNE